MAILFVLFLHSSQLCHFVFTYTPVVVETRIMQALFIPAVYIFFMNSGAMLLDYNKRYSTKEFYQHRVKKVIYPLVIWSLLYYLYNLKWTAFPGPMQRQRPGVRDFFIAFLTNHINNTFWFLYVILFLYLVTPIVARLTKHQMLVVAIVVLCLFDFLPYFYNLFGYQINNPYYRSLQSLLNLGYFILGYLLKVNYFSKKTENYLIIIGLVMLVCTIINAMLPQANAYLSFSPLMYSLALYILVKRGALKITSSKVKNMFAKMASVSLGIYVTHPLMYHIFTKVVPVDWTSQVYIWLMPIVVYIIGGVIIFYLRRIKFIKILFP